MFLQQRYTADTIKGQYSYWRGLFIIDSRATEGGTFRLRNLIGKTLPDTYYSDRLIKSTIRPSYLYTSRFHPPPITLSCRRRKKRPNHLMIISATHLLYPQSSPLIGWKRFVHKESPGHEHSPHHHFFITPHNTTMHLPTAPTLPSRPHWHTRAASTQARCPPNRPTPLRRPQPP